MDGRLGKSVSILVLMELCIKTEIKRIVGNRNWSFQSLF